MIRILMREVFCDDCLDPDSLVGLLRCLPSSEVRITIFLSRILYIQSTFEATSLNFSFISHFMNSIFLWVTSESLTCVATSLRLWARPTTSLQLNQIYRSWCCARLKNCFCLLSCSDIFIILSLMKQPVHPSQLFNGLLFLDFKEAQCIEQKDTLPTKGDLSLKESLKKQIVALQRQKQEYLNLIEDKQRLVGTLKQLLVYRESIDYDHKYKRLKFEHYNYPYRGHLKIKEELNEQRLVNLQKRRKIKELEEEIKHQERAIEMRRRQKQNLNIWKIGNVNEDRNKDCDEDFWIKRIEKMKNIYLNRGEEWRREKIKHDYNLMVEKTNQCCAIGHACELCSPLSKLLADRSGQVKSRGYAREALLSPRYSSIYRRGGQII